MSSALFVAILGVSALVTSFISGILGMAGGLVLMGILLAMMPITAAMMYHGITQLASNVWRAVLWRRHVDWRVIRGYAYGALAMLAVFAVLRFVVSKPVALIVMGLTPFLTLALPEKLHLNVERRGHPLACGVVCTVLSLTAGVAGPILDLFFVRSKMSRQSVVATKAMTQSLGHLLKIVYFGGMAATGPGAGVSPWLAAAMVVLAFAGTTLARPVLDRMNDKSFRLWTRWTVMTIGAAYIVNGVVLLLR